MYPCDIDPLTGWIEPWPVLRCTKPSCECDDGGPRCHVCEAEWEATLADAEIFLERVEAAPVDPWLEEQREPDELDDDGRAWAVADALDKEPEDA